MPPRARASTTVCVGLRLGAGARLATLAVLLSLANRGARADEAPAPASPPATPRFTVVIDAGHGGSNLGAPGATGVYEKKVTLALAKLLRRRLEQDGLRVVCTRDGDSYMTLGARVRRANAVHGDAFLSLHANATPDHQRRGFFAYVLSREVNDIEARRAVEAAADPAEAAAARAQARQLALASGRLAETLRRYVGRVRAPDLGSRQAPFDVLEGLRMPGALVEMGFIDHPEEGPELLLPEVLGSIADGLADGVEEYARREGPLARPAGEPATTAEPARP